jgi:hypothetical protein
MKKFLAIFMIIAGCALNAEAQNAAAFRSAVFSSASADGAIQIQSAGVVANRLIWTTTGTVSSCTVKLQKSADGVTWSDLIANQTCTAAGYSAITTGTANYVRINVTALAGGGQVGVVYNAWRWNPEAGFSFPLLAADGTAAAPAYSFASATNTGMFLGGGRIAFAVGGTTGVYVGGNFIDIATDSAILRLGSAADVRLYRDAANTLALRNGGTSGTPTPQRVNLYNFCEGQNCATGYERVGLYWTANAAYLMGESAGTGVARTLYIGGGSNIYLMPGGAVKWNFQNSGNILAQTDNTYDIGASGASRPRTGYFGTSVVTPAIVITNTVTPANSAAACTAKTLWSDGTYIYYCIASGNIKRTAALATF